MTWFFDGLGTLIIGLLLGGGAGGAVGWRIGAKSSQKQRARDHAVQVQIGGVNGEPPRDG